MVDAMSLHLQAAGGDPRAQFQLARMKLIGRDVPYAPDDAMRLVIAACAQKYPKALLLHAALAALGLGRTQNFDHAIALVAEAAAIGDARAQGQLAALGGAKGFDAASWFAPGEATRYCDAPRIYAAPNFLSKPACVWLADQGAKTQIPAPIRDPGRGGSVVDAARSNTTSAFSSIQSDLVLQLTRLRIAAAIGVPIAHQEPTNILRYERGQEYRPHYDFITEAEEYGFVRELRQSGQRVATVLVYLNDNYEGGETEFPRLNFRFKGKTGDALIFWNLSAEGQRERNALHAGLPVTTGEKWILSQWIHEKPFPLM